MNYEACGRERAGRDVDLQLIGIQLLEYLPKNRDDALMALEFAKQHVARIFPEEDAEERDAEAEDEEH